jgi:hypothetical protein
MKFISWGAEGVAALELIHLVTTTIQVCRDTVPIGYWEDPKKSLSEHLYENMPLYLIPIGKAPGIHEWMEDSRRFTLLLNETLDKFNLVVSHGIEPQVTQKERVGKIIFFICRLKECHNALKFDQCISRSKWSVEDAVPNILHMHKRLIEKVMTLIFVLTLDEASASNKGKRARKAKEIEKIINTTVFGTAEKPGRYCVPFHKQKSEILDVSFNDEWAQKLEKKMEQMIPLILTKQLSRPNCWLICLRDLSYILSVLNRKDDFTAREIDILQDDIDAWADNWIAVNGREGCIIYTHILTYHTVPFFRKWRNL